MVSPISGGISAFIGALRRDPLRAGFIRHIGFISALSSRYLFPDELTGQFWTSLEEALHLVTRAKSVALLERDGFSPWEWSNFPDHFIDIISNVFKTTPIETLHSRLHSDRLFHLCQTWPSLTALRTEAALEEGVSDLPPDALPQLCHLEADIQMIRHIAPGRSVQTLYQVGMVPSWENDFELLASTVRECETLQRIQVNCYAGGEDYVDVLPAFAHDTLRFFQLRIFLVGSAFGHHEGTPYTVIGHPGPALRSFSTFPKTGGAPSYPTAQGLRNRCS